MGRIPSPPPNLSLEGLSSPLRSQKRTWWLEKNPLPKFQRFRDNATFGISFVMESDTLLPFDLDKEAIICMRSYLK